jgi:hypothetical protein
VRTESGPSRIGHKGLGVKQRGARSAGNPLAALRRGGDWNGAVEIPAGAPVFDPFVGDCPWLGTLDRWFLAGMTHDSVNPAAKTIPEALFMLYQMTFAIITVALVALSVADSGRPLPCQHGRTGLCGRLLVHLFAGLVAAQ